MRGHTSCTKNSRKIRAEMCAADLSDDPLGSMYFAQEVEQKNPGPSPVHQRRNDRGAEENYKAAASKLHKIQKAPDGLTLLNRTRRHETLRSNASFETKHHPPVAFQELPSYPRGSRNKGDLTRTKSCGLTPGPRLPAEQCNHGALHTTSGTSRFFLAP